MNFEPLYFKIYSNPEEKIKSAVIMWHLGTLPPLLIMIVGREF